MTTGGNNANDITQTEAVVSHTFSVYFGFSVLIKTNQLSFCSRVYPGSDVIW